MSFRIAHDAPPGSLLKADRPERKKQRKPVRRGREHNADYLKLVRRCPCLGCDNDPAGVAAHVRLSSAVALKPMPGFGVKPSDRYALPLCPTCHTASPEAQHEVGEVKFWAGLGLDPLVICERLNAASPDIEAMRAECFKAREERK